METSYNGYPASKDPAEINIKSYPVKGTDRKLRCAESVGPLLAAFASEFHELIEPIDEGTFDDWAYAYRMVRGNPTKLSCHSSGTAIDLNATKHPLGKYDTFAAEKVPMIRALAKKYGLKWGGDFKSRPDDMHFEVTITPAKAKELITKLGLQNALIIRSNSNNNKSDSSAARNWRSKCLPALSERRSLHRRRGSNGS